MDRSNYILDTVEDHMNKKRPEYVELRYEETKELKHTGMRVRDLI